MRPYLGRIPVDGLTAAQDNVYRADFADGLAEGVAGGKGVGGGELAVGQQHDPVGAPVQGLTQDLGRRRRTHRQHRDRAAVTVLDLEAHLQRVQVLGVHYRRQGGAVDRTLFGHGLAGKVLGVGDLLDTHDNVISHVFASVFRSWGSAFATG